MWESIVGFFLIPLVMWLFLGFISGAYFYCVEKDSPFWAWVLSILAVVVYYGEIVTILSNWQLVLFFIFVWLLVGAIFSAFKWWRYCKQFVKDHPASGLPDYRKDDVRGYYQEYLSMYNNKSRLIGWTILWPWSLIWSVIRGTVITVFDNMRDFYNKIANAVINKAIGE